MSVCTGGFFNVSMCMCGCVYVCVCVRVDVRMCGSCKV